MLKFWETVFRRRLPFSLRKNTHGKFVEKCGEKIRRKSFVFRCVFRSVFCFALATPYFEHFLTFKSKKFAWNPFCKKFPLTKWPSSELDFSIRETKMVHFGPFWPEEVHFGQFGSADRTLAIRKVLVPPETRFAKKGGSIQEPSSDSHKSPDQRKSANRFARIGPSKVCTSRNRI